MTQTLKLSHSPKALASLAEQFKALGDETRLGLMMAVAASEDAEACVCDLTPDTGLAQSTVSHHLKLLVDSGLFQSHCFLSFQKVQQNGYLDDLHKRKEESPYKPDPVLLRGITIHLDL
jgi:DNA-binding transcriptional ArsR family regulator